MSVEEDWKKLKKIMKLLPIIFSEKKANEPNRKKNKKNKEQNKIIKEKPMKEEDKVTVMELKEKLRLKILSLRKQNNPEGAEIPKIVNPNSKKIKKLKKNEKKQQKELKNIKNPKNKKVMIQKKKNIETKQNQKKWHEKQETNTKKNTTNGPQKTKTSRPGFEGKKSSYF